MSESLEIDERHHRKRARRWRSVLACCLATASCATGFTPGSSQIKDTTCGQRRKTSAPTILEGHTTIDAQQSDSDDRYDDERDSLFRRELFSVAPMMGHTNRHHHYFYRLLSSRTHLYTEMIPSAQIVRAYRRVRSVYLNVDPPLRGGGTGGEIHPEEVMEVARRLAERPGLEYQRRRDDSGGGSGGGGGAAERTLSELIGTFVPPPAAARGDPTPPPDDSRPHPVHPVVLQLGGRDPETLRAASAIGLAVGNYDEVNLNCGCPSNAVGGRSGGAALMKDPDLVARCVEAMGRGVGGVVGLNHRSGSGEAGGGGGGGEAGRRREPTVTVKHRLGVRDAAAFDAAADREKGDDEAYEECRNFVKTVALGGAVTKCHVHARLGLLGEFAPEEADGGGGDSATARGGGQKLWVPGTEGGGSGSGSGSTNTATGGKRDKVDHKREQERAKRRARQATIKNRDVPPLRPDVVNRLADAFPEVDFVANGGIQTLRDVERIVDEGSMGSGQTGVVGAMVGRAAINHPCAFASADRLWEVRGGDAPTIRARPTRGEVLRDYVRYCEGEEDRLSGLGASQRDIAALRRCLVGVPFHLFMGEEGNDAFQRRIKKLTSKTVLIKASSILSGAASFIPAATLDKCVDDYVPWEDIAKFERAFRRSSAMQRIVY